jgi:UDP-N-acetylglucosamine acyltransferase
MTKIHPSSVIDPSAILHPDVEVGPFCHIGPQVEIGCGTRLIGHISIAGPTRIGEGNVFYPYCSIGQRSQDLKYTSEPTFLEIGNNNSFREFCTVNRGTLPGTKTLIGHHGNFLAYSHIAHDCTVGDHVIFSNNGTIAGHVTVEDHVIIGGLSGVHQFCRLGQHSIVGGCTKIVQDVPPYMIADGNPAEVRGINQVGLERRGFVAEDTRALREAYRLLYRSNLNVKQACEKIQTDFSGPDVIARLLAFVESSQRGIIR